MEPEFNNSNNINIHIDDFDGPLELLLHLIKQSEMDIYDIQIEKITEQYLGYLTEMENLNVNIAGEYFVMASNLMAIKSKLLLPRNDEIDENDDYEDPRDELVNQLLIYQEYKEVSKVLKQMETKSAKYHSVDPTLPTVDEMIDFNGNHKFNVRLIQQAFDRVIDKIKANEPYVHSVIEWQFTVKEQSEFVMEKLSQQKHVEFDQLFENTNNIEMVVTTFLSLLELVKEHKISVGQVDDKIYLEQVEVGDE
ncbi:MAG: segregation/condensation protein A [Apilactobacillus sp.]|uniref:segregation and condensation protein A n=1 Tax=Apilactobacillus TaxID=2767877 RepID=UPI0025E6C3DB|nr:segregation/condensation protein A [Apilactobacillus sp.]MCT6822420.1 segregation/condensation protein A [Apilactobacillus sp.]MCT6858814.1 segregation/condensation protein A [Apilactobacillus sp.]